MIGTVETENSNLLDRIIAIFESELKTSPIAPDDDFFDLGGDSLMAENLINQINIEFSKNWDVSNILDYPTSSDMAVELGRETKKNELVFEVPGCTGTEPMVFVHGGSGGNYKFGFIGDELKKRWKIIGIRARGHAAGEYPHTNVTDLVDDYLQSTFDYFGKYPKILAGNCIGSLFALEMAKKIYEKTGLRPILVAIDPAPFFAKYHQKETIYKPRAVLRLKNAFYCRARDVLTTLGCANTMAGRKVRIRALIYFLQNNARKIYPSPFPLDILLFVSSKTMERSVDGFTKWKTEDVVLRGHPLEGRHNEIYDKNNRIIDKEIVDFVDELAAKNHAGSSSVGKVG